MENGGDTVFCRSANARDQSSSGSSIPPNYYNSSSYRPFGDDSDTGYSSHSSVPPPDTLDAIDVTHLFPQTGTDVANRVAALSVRSGWRGRCTDSYVNLINSVDLEEENRSIFIGWTVDTHAQAQSSSPVSSAVSEVVLWACSSAIDPDVCLDACNALSVAKARAEAAQHALSDAERLLKAHAGRTGTSLASLASASLASTMNAGDMSAGNMATHKIPNVQGRGGLGTVGPEAQEGVVGEVTAQQDPAELDRLVSVLRQEAAKATEELEQVTESLPSGLTSTAPVTTILPAVTTIITTSKPRVLPHPNPTTLIKVVDNRMWWYGWAHSKKWMTVFVIAALGLLSLGFFEFPVDHTTGYHGGSHVAVALLIEALCLLIIAFDWVLMVGAEAYIDTRRTYHDDNSSTRDDNVDDVDVFSSKQGKKNEKKRLSPATSSSSSSSSTSTSAAAAANSSNDLAPPPISVHNNLQYLSTHYPHQFTAPYTALRMPLRTSSGCQLLLDPREPGPVKKDIFGQTVGPHRVFERHIPEFDTDIRRSGNGNRNNIVSPVKNVTASPSRKTEDDDDFTKPKNRKSRSNYGMKNSGKKSSSSLSLSLLSPIAEANCDEDAGLAFSFPSSVDQTHTSSTSTSTSTSSSSSSAHSPLPALRLLPFTYTQHMSLHLHIRGWQLVRAVALVCCVADMTQFAAHYYNAYGTFAQVRDFATVSAVAVRYTRWARVLLLLSRIRSLRTVCMGYVATVKQSIQVISISLLMVCFFALLGFFYFNAVSDPNPESTLPEAFASLPNALYYVLLAHIAPARVLQLLEPYYDGNPWMSVYHFAFVFLLNIVMMDSLVTISYRAYKGYMRDMYLERAQRRKDAFKLAFHTLKRKVSVYAVGHSLQSTSVPMLVPQTHTQTPTHAETQARTHASAVGDTSVPAYGCVRDEVESKCSHDGEPCTQTDTHTSSSSPAPAPVLMLSTATTATTLAHPLPNQYWACDGVLLHTWIHLCRAVASHGYRIPAKVTLERAQNPELFDNPEFLRDITNPKFRDLLSEARIHVEHIPLSAELAEDLDADSLAPTSLHHVLSSHTRAGHSTDPLSRTNTRDSAGGRDGVCSWLSRCVGRRSRRQAAQELSRKMERVDAVALTLFDLLKKTKTVTTGGARPAAGTVSAGAGDGDGDEEDEEDGSVVVEYLDEDGFLEACLLLELAKTEKGNPEVGKGKNSQFGKSVSSPIPSQSLVPAAPQSCSSQEPVRNPPHRGNSQTSGNSDISSDPLSVHSLSLTTSSLLQDAVTQPSIFAQDDIHSETDTSRVVSHDEGLISSLVNTTLFEPPAVSALCSDDVQYFATEEEQGRQIVVPMDQPREIGTQVGKERNRRNSGIYVRNPENGRISGRANTATGSGVGTGIGGVASGLSSLRSPHPNTLLSPSVPVPVPTSSLPVPTASHAHLSFALPMSPAPAPAPVPGYDHAQRYTPGYVSGTGTVALTAANTHATHASPFSPTPFSPTSGAAYFGAARHAAHTHTDTAAHAGAGVRGVAMGVPGSDAWSTNTTNSATISINAPAPSSPLSPHPYTYAYPHAYPLATQPSACANNHTRSRSSPGRVCAWVAAIAATVKAAAQTYFTTRVHLGCGGCKCCKKKEERNATSTPSTSAAVSPLTSSPSASVDKRQTLLISELVAIVPIVTSVFQMLDLVAYRRTHGLHFDYNRYLETSWGIVGNCIFAFFFLEGCAKLWVFGWRIYKKKYMNLLDLAINTGTLLCLIISPVTMNTYYMILSLRTLRLLRIFMLVPKLNDILTTIAHVLPSLYNLVAAFLLILLAFAMIFEDIFGGKLNPDLNPLLLEPACKEWLPYRSVMNFDDLQTSIMTCIHMATLAGWPIILGAIRAALSTVHDGVAHMVDHGVYLMFAFRMSLTMVVLPIFVGFTMESFKRNMAAVVGNDDRSTSAKKIKAKDLLTDSDGGRAGQSDGDPGRGSGGGDKQQQDHHQQQRSPRPQHPGTSPTSHTDTHNTQHTHHATHAQPYTHALPSPSSSSLSLSSTHALLPDTAHTRHAAMPVSHSTRSFSSLDSDGISRDDDTHFWNGRHAPGDIVPATSSLTPLLRENNSNIAPNPGVSLAPWSPLPPTLAQSYTYSHHAETATSSTVTHRGISRQSSWNALPHAPPSLSTSEPSLSPVPTLPTRTPSHTASSHAHTHTHTHTHASVPPRDRDTVDTSAGTGMGLGTGSLLGAPAPLSTATSNSTSSNTNSNSNSVVGLPGTHSNSNAISPFLVDAHAFRKNTTVNPATGVRVGGARRKLARDMSNTVVIEKTAAYSHIVLEMQDEDAAVLDKYVE